MDIMKNTLLSLSLGACFSLLTPYTAIAATAENLEATAAKVVAPAVAEIKKDSSTHNHTQDGSHSHMAPQAMEVELEEIAKETEELLKKNKAELKNYPEMVKAISTYMNAWQKQDFATMHSLENWKSANPLNLTQYIQSFDSDFRVHSWKVTKIAKEGVEGEHRVLVLITHNPPKQVAALIPAGKTVRSTLIQWWEQDKDKKVSHLFHVENRRLLKPELLNPLSKEAGAVNATPEK